MPCRRIGYQQDRLVAMMHAAERQAGRTKVAQGVVVALVALVALLSGGAAWLLTSCIRRHATCRVRCRWTDATSSARCWSR